MKRTTIFIFLVFLVGSAGMAWAIDYTGEGSNCSVPPFVRQGAPPNVLLDISVETPMQGAAHPDITCTGDPSSSTYGCNPAACRYTSGGRNISNCYDSGTTYYGYFDSSAKYSYDTTNKYFYKNAAGSWSGNFLNWATMTAIDAVRKAFTGGNRDTDTVGNTILLRANQTLSPGDSWFPIKRTNSGSSYTPHAGTIYIVNRGKGFAVCSASDCSVTLDANRFPTSASPNGIAVYNARIKVCDSSAGLESNCREYGSGNYKPVGVLQRYADNMRFGLITYALGPNDATNPSNRAATNGGVIRANMKWICPTIPKGLQYHDSSGTLVTCTSDGGCTNPESEINADGTFVYNPDGVTGGNSGVINYLNKFGYQQGYKSHDPISEMYYEAIRYYKNLGPTTEYTQFDNGTNIPAIDDGFPVYANRSGLNWRDPIIYRCQQNFIIGLNDANPWYDKRLPGTFFTSTAYSADGNDTVDGFHPTGTYVDHGEPSNPDTDIDVETLTNQVGSMEGINGTSACIGCVAGGTCDFNSTSKLITNLGQVHGTCYGPSRRNSYYIAGLAYYAHSNDLRDDHDGMQNITTYMIDSQESNTDMLVGQMNMLYLAAKYGGFTDRDGNDQPNLQSEWDKDSDGFPDAYFFASDPSQIGTALETTFGEILQKTSSGTAVSVLSTSAEGEGSLFQAFFNPAVYEGSNKISWVGYLNALWVDQYGNLREDTGKDTNPSLVLDEDYVIQYALNANGDTVVNRYRDLDGNGHVDAGDFLDTISLEELSPTYDYGDTLANTAPSARTIYTFMDADPTDGLPPQTGEWIELSTANAGTLYSYLNAADAAEATDIINFIRGGIVSNCRNRQIDGDTWKLGDIVYSTPSVVGRPMGQYHIIYGDSSYLPFLQTYKNRETIVYVGANDGMLHAFSAGQYHEGDNPGTAGKTERGWYDGANRGTELWGYVPYSLLPHLKWLADPDYCHVDYVDLKTRVVDARIFTADADHPYGWGTVLIGAMRLGGTPVSGGPGSRTYRSAYFALDITNPTSTDYPKLLWEFWDKDDEALGYTYSYPTIIRRGAKADPGDWYVIFGTGPSNFDGGGATTGKVYVRNLFSGAYVTQFTITDADVVGHPFFLSSPISIDRGLDNQVNVAYIGASYNDSGWKGKIFRIDTDNNDPTAWSLSTFFSSDKPITSTPTAALDPFGRLWLFWGSGRYFSDTDKADSSIQRLYGVWDPGAGSFAEANLNNVTDVDIYEDGYVDVNGNGSYDAGDMIFSQYLAGMRSDYGSSTKYGWYVNISSGGERFLTKPTILGNIVLFPTFDPNDDLCDYGGDSYLFALYYETGTAYMKSVMGTDNTATIIVGGNTKDLIVKKKYLGPGMPTSAVIHAGSQEGVTAMIQLGTGVVEAVDVNPAESPKNKVLYWREKGD
jgi:type IV pilus assembly protein PilY1